MTRLALRACFLAVSVCVGVPHPGATPRIEVVPDEPHITDGKPAHGFQCGWYEDGSAAYCAGLWDDGLREVVVSTRTTAAIPHEFIHAIVERKHLWCRGRCSNRADNDHTGPWWHCERKVNVLPCAALYQ